MEKGFWIRNFTSFLDVSIASMKELVTHKFCFLPTAWNGLGKRELPATVKAAGEWSWVSAKRNFHSPYKYSWGSGAHLTKTETTAVGRSKELLPCLHIPHLSHTRDIAHNREGLLGRPIRQKMMLWLGAWSAIWARGLNPLCHRHPNIKSSTQCRVHSQGHGYHQLRSSS